MLAPHGVDVDRRWGEPRKKACLRFRALLAPLLGAALGRLPAGPLQKADPVCFSDAFPFAAAADGKCLEICHRTQAGYRGRGCRRLCPGWSPPGIRHTPYVGSRRDPHEAQPAHERHARRGGDHADALLADAVLRIGLRRPAQRREVRRTSRRCMRLPVQVHGCE